jgi:drug/metabolite transporter (DMT)-like permease
VRSVALALGSWDFLVVRLFVSALIFIALLPFVGHHIDKKDWPTMVWLSLLGVLGYYVGSSFGYAYAPAGVGTLIFSTQPMLIALLAWFAGTDRLTPFTLLGLAVSFVGSALLVWGDDITAGGVSQRDLLIGCGLLFAGSAVWAIYVVYARPLIQKYGALRVTSLANIIIAIPILPFLRADMAAKVLAMPPFAKFSMLLLFTIGTSSVITWNYAAAHARPTLLGMSLYVMPVVAVFAGWLLLDEPVTSKIMISAAIILAGVALSQIKGRAA